MNAVDAPMVTRRVLVIDDNEAIHADFRKILAPQNEVSDALLAAEAALFGGTAAPVGTRNRFELMTASQGREGLQRLQEACARGEPFAMAFVDMRMPPGWDGLETIEQLWREQPDLEVVICTAFSDYSWDEVCRRLGDTDRLLVVKKPFDHIEIQQVAAALTQKWHLQQQSKRVLEHLAELVDERTADLERAKSAAEHASRAKTMFLANMSHELRTPLTAIRGYAEELWEHLEARQAEPFEREAARIISRNATHLVDLVGDLLDVAKLENGKLSVHPERCGLFELIADVMAVVEPAARQKALPLEVHFDTELPVAVVTDPLRTRQILINLLHNAVKFTSSGSVQLRLALDETAEPTLVAEVIDTGPGIAAEALTKIFEPFEQVDPTTTRRFGGSGLGLAISRQLARLLGGDISAHSQPAVGSRFVVTLATGPLQGVPRCSSAPATGDPTGASPEPQASLHGVRILVVEDGRDNQRLIGHVLRKTGCEVEFADDGRQCLERVAAAAAPFDLILMDMQMPVMDGETATEILRSEGATMPIVALTANATAANRATCRRVGCDAFLTKPIDRERLRATIASLLGR